MIAITFALPTESSRFLPRIQEKNEIRRAGFTTIRGRLEGHAVEVLHTGVGEKICQSRIQHFLREDGFQSLISSGFAGAVREDLRVTDLILAKNYSDAQLFTMAQRTLRGRALQAVKLFTSPTIIDSPEQRNVIAQANAAEVVDMETAVIARACAVQGIPMLSLRAISDSPAEPLPAPPPVLFDLERQRTDAGKLAFYLMRHPSAIARLIRFANKIERARENLADALITLLRENFH